MSTHLFKKNNIVFVIITSSLVLIILLAIYTASKVIYSSYSKSCVYDGTTYKNGEEISIDDCNSCSCQDGEIACTAIGCLDKEE